MTPESTIQQIRDVITLLITKSIVDHQHYPCKHPVGRTVQIGIAGSPDLSASLKGISYEKAYLALQAAGAYHMRMIDGALLQLLYCFSGRSLLSHRLCFFPSPSLEIYDQAYKIYENDEMFGDIFSLQAVRTPIRFDYSSSDDEFTEIDHPRSHFTLGQYKGCRIPVNGPLTPLRFMRFILRNFYNSVYEEVNIDKKAQGTSFLDTITEKEKTILYITT